MKYRTIFYLLLFSLNIAYVYVATAQVKTACDEGNNLHTTATGTFVQDCASCPKIPVYKDLPLIPIANPPSCGLPRAKITLSNSPCRVLYANGTVKYYGSLATYNLADVIPCNVPLDDHLTILILVASGLGFFFLRKSSFFIV